MKTERTRLVRDFDPDLVRRIKADADHDLHVSGAELGGVALAHGLVDAGFDDGIVFVRYGVRPV